MVDAPYVKPTAAQRRALAAYVETGSYSAACHRLRVSRSAMYRRMEALRERTGLTVAQAIYVGARDGWLQIEGGI